MLVVTLDEIAKNDFNLNVPRYVDTFEPEPTVDVGDALDALRTAQSRVLDAESRLAELLRQIGYEE